MSKVYAVATSLKQTIHQVQDTLKKIFAASRQRNGGTFSQPLITGKLIPLYTTTTHQNQLQMHTFTKTTSTKAVNGFSRWMTALALLVFTMALPFAKSYGQSITNYAFATGTNGSLEDLSSGATAIMTGNNDDLAGTVTPIGFNFVFMGGTYTHFSANSNGQMLLHTSSGATAAASQQSTLTAGLAILSPFSGDNEVNNGIRIKTIGTAPNRKLVIEWNQFYVNFVDLTNAGNMQVWLQEGSGVITYVYGEIYNSASSSQSRSIFIASGNTATTAGSITINTSPTAPTFAASATLVSNTIALGSGTTTGSPLINNIGSSTNTTRRFFSFTPPTAAVADPTTLTFTAVTGTTTTPNWVDNSTTEGGFIVTRANDAGFTSNVVTTTVASTTVAGTGTVYTAPQTGLTPGITYFYKVQAVAEAQLSSTISSSQTTAAAATYYYIGAATGDIAVAANWDLNPAGSGGVTIRSTPLTTDILILDGAGTTAGAATTLTLSASVSIGALQITNSTAVTLTSSTATTRTLTLTGAAGDVLSIPAGSSLIFNNSTQQAAIAFSTGTGMTGTIAGTLTFSGTGTSNVLTTTGGTGTVVTVTSTGVVNLGIAANSLVGSVATLVIANGANINSSGATTGAAPVPLATWGASSTLTVTGLTSSTTAPSNVTQSFGNIIFNCPSLTSSYPWFGSSTGTIQGNLTVTTGSGNFRLVSSATTTVTGNVSVTAGTLSPFSSTGIVNVLGTTTIASGATMDLSLAAGTYSQRGSTLTNNGTIKGSNSTTVSSLNFFSPTNAALTFAGSGTVTPALASLGVQTTGGLTITHTNTIATLRVNLFTGTVTGSNKITIGSGAALASIVQIGATGLTTAGGSFGSAPTFNLGTGTYGVLYQFETGARSTGFEIPSTRTITAATIGNPNNVTVTGGALGIGTLTLQSGKLVTTSSNLVTITGTTTTSTARSTYTSASATSSGTTITVSSTTSLFVGMNVTVTSGTGAFATNTVVTSIPSTTTFVVSATPTTPLSAAAIAGIGGWVSGPLAITLPVSLATGTSYTIPVGKGTYNPFQLVNPTTAAGTSPVIQAEVFDAATGGTPGALMGTINTSRYWAASLTTVGNFTNTLIALTDTRGTQDGIANSSTLTGAYDHIGGIVSTLTTTSIATTAPASTTLGGFYLMGNLGAASLSNLAITPTGNLCTNATRTVTVTVTPGGAAITTVTLNYNINGTAQTAISMSNTGGNNWSGVIPVVTPSNGTVTWSVTATDANSLATTATGTAYTDEPLNGYTITATASNATVCASSPSILTLAVSKNINATIGTGVTVTSATTQPTAFCNRWGSYRMQLVFTAAELSGAGLTAGNISSMAFNITSLGDAATNASFRVKIGATALSTLTTFVDTTTGFTDVYNPKTYTHTATGLQTIPFDAPYNWNGTSNIIVQVVHLGANSTNNAQTLYTATAGNTVAYTSTAQTDGASLSTNRLNIVFASNSSPTLSNINWSDGTSSVGTSNPQTINPTATKTYTATFTALGCASVTPTGVTVTVNPKPTAPTAGLASTQCGTAAPAVSVSDANGFTTPTFKWYADNVTTTALQSSTSTTYTTAISSTTNFFVSVVNPTTGCESNRTQVTANVSNPDPVAASSNGPICLNSNLQLTATVTAGANANNYTYSWAASPATGSGIATTIAGGTGAFGSPASVTVLPTTAGTYLYTVTATDAVCATTANVSVIVKPNPTISSIAASFATACSGSPVTLTGTSLGITTGTAVLGTGSTTLTSAATGTMFPGAWGGGKTQFLILASELTTAGLAAGPITALAFEPTTSGQAYQGFNVSIGNTALTALASPSTTPLVNTGLTQVYVATGTNGGFTPTANVVNTLTFGTGGGASSFTWDGTSNILVSFCWSSNPTATTSTGTTVKGDAVGFVASATGQSDSQLPSAFCALTTGFGLSSTSSNRPKFTFSGQASTNIAGNANLVWTWAPGVTGAVATANPTTQPTTTYTPTLLNTTTNCSTTAVTGVSITVNPVPPTPNSFPSSQCGTGLPTAFVGSNSGSGNPVFVWYTVQTGGTAFQTGESNTNTTLSISTTTTFYVSESNGTCESPRVAVVCTVNTPPAVNIAAVTPKCLGAGFNLAATSTNDPNYNYTWSNVTLSLNRSGLTNGTTGATVTGVTPDSAGVFTYKVDAVDATTGNSFSGCVTNATISVTINALPAIIKPISAVPAIVCAGVPSVLTATTNAVTAGTSTSIGTATTSTTATEELTAFCNRRVTFQHQAIFTKAELNAAGLFAGNITAIKYNVVTSVGDASTTTNYTVKMGHTALSALTTSFVTTGLTTVRNAATYTHALGLNTITFNTPFNWDGTSNIIIDVTHGGIDNINNAQTTYSTTTGNLQSYGFDGATSATLSTKRLNVVFVGQVGGAGAGSLTWSWNYVGNPGTPLTGNSVSVTPAASTWYTVTGLSAATGCADTTGIQVTVNPVPPAPSGTNGTDQCGAGISDASVSSNATDPQAPPFFKWYSAPTGGTVLQSGTSTTYTTSISVTTDWYVAEVSAAGCEGPRVHISTVASDPDPLTVVSSTGLVACINESFDITSSYTPDFNNFATFNLTATGGAASGVTGTVSLTANATGSDPITVTPTAAGTYTYTITANDPDKGCTSVKSITVVVNPNPTITSFTVTPSPICEGGLVTLTATKIGAAQGTATVGAGADVSTLSTDGTPYRVGNTVGNQFKNQYLFLASELNALGLQPGNITSVALNLVGSGGGTLSNFAIKIGTTSQTAMTSTYVTGLTTVLSLPTYPSSGTVTTGIQSHTFTSPFVWNGTSNLVLEICAQLATSGSAGTLAGDTKTFAATILNSPTTTACGSATGGGTSTVRPQVTFGGQVGADNTTDNTWVFNPGAIDGGISAFATTTASTSISAYTVTATANGCSITSAPVSITVNPIPVAPSVSNSTQCGVGVPTASVSGFAGTTKWYDAATGGNVIQRGGATYLGSISTTTHFYVSDSSVAGCEGPRADLTAVVTAPPTLVITPASAIAFCQGGSVVLDAATGSDPSYTAFTWSASPSTGAGLSAASGTSITAAPTAASAYIITVTGTGGGCTNTATITVTSNPNPVITTATATPATICAGGSSTLAATGSQGITTGTLTVGAGADVSTLSTDGTPYRVGNTVGNQFKNQYLFLASELNALGLQAGNITSVALNLVGSGGGTLSNFAIKIGTTSQTAMTSTYVTGLTTVLSLPTYPSSGTVTTGIQSHTFTSPFVWNGTSNLVLEICAQLATSGSAGTLAGDTKTFAATILNSPTTTACGSATGGGTSTVRPQVTFGGQVGADNTATLSWLWNGALAGASIVVTPTVTTTYSLKATNTTTGCFTNLTVPVTVNVATIAAVPTATPASTCPGVFSQLNAHATGGGPFTYLWDDPTAATTATVSVNPLVTTTYHVTVKDACGNPTTAQVTLTVNPSPTASIVEGNTTLCSPASTTLTASTNAASPVYAWYKDDVVIAGATSSTYTINTISTGAYKLRITDGVTGCLNNSAPKTISINPTPEAVVIAPLSSTICSGANVSLTANGGQTSLEAVVGTKANKNANSGYPAPFSVYYGGQRMQVLVLASELTARGLVSGSVIKSIGFPVDSLGSNWGTTTTSCQNFKVKMGLTNLTALSTFTAGLATYYGPTNFTPVVGSGTANLLSLTSGPTWDGTSNLIIETTFSNNVTGTVNDAVIQYNTVTTGVNSLIVRRADGVTAATIESSTTVDVGPNTSRPDFVLNASKPAVITWSPATGLNTTSGATVIANPTVTTTYTATSTTSTGCTSSSNVTVTVNPLTAISVPAAPASQTVLQNDPSPTALTLTATGTAPITYQWYSNTINNNTTGTSLGTANGAQTASYSPVTSALGTLYYYAIVTGGCGPAVTSTVVSVNVTNANSWKQGNPTTNWSTPSNWSTNQVPNAATDGIIPNGNTPYPVLTSSVAVNNLTIDPGATVGIAANTFTINGTITGTGTLTGSATSNLVMNSPVATVYFTPAANTLKDLTVSAGTTTLGNALNITGGTAANTYGTVTVASGATLASGGFLTIKSNIFGTARVAAGATSGNYITGDVTVERYIPANTKRSWRLLAVPTKGTKTIKQTWQENQAPMANGLPGFGTLITSNIATLPPLQAAGFDTYTQYPSMQSYNSATQAWVYVTATNAAPIQTNKGYFLYIRGDRSVTTSASSDAAGATVLRTTGTLYQGDNNPAVSIAAGKFEPVGNTFASAINFTGLTKTGGISNTFYVWDSKLLSGTSLGAYQTFNGSIGYTPATPGGSYPQGQANTTIESGQAFMLGATGTAGTVAIPEASKTTGNQFNPFRPASMPGLFKTSLYKVSGTTSTFADNNIGAFDNAFSNNVDGDDAPKFLHSGENVSILRNGVELIIEARQPITGNDTLFFSMRGMQAAQQYRFEFSTNNLPLPGLTAYVEDKFLNSVTPIDLNAAVYQHNFSVDATSASAAQDRFRIVFKQVGLGPLPVSFINISANHVSAGVEVAWTVAAERSIRQYEVESSADGRNFNAAGTVAATGRLSYNWLDAAATSGITYYRIKSIGTAGDIKYSAVVKVNLNVKPSIAISPNPVEGAVANLQFKNQVKGRYSIRLLSDAGQAVMVTVVEHPGGNSVQTLNLPGTIARGAYQLEITSPDKTKQVQTLFINTAK